MLKPGSPEWSEYTQLDPLMSRATSVGHWGVHVAGLLYRQLADLIEDTPRPAAPGLHCLLSSNFSRLAFGPLTPALIGCPVRLPNLESFEVA